MINLPEESLTMYNYLSKLTIDNPEVVSFTGDKIDEIRSLIGLMRSEIIRLSQSVKSEDEVRKIMKDSMPSVITEVVDEKIGIAKDLAKIEAYQTLLDTIPAIANGRSIILTETVLAIIKANRAVSIRNVQQITADKKNESANN